MILPCADTPRVRLGHGPHCVRRVPAQKTRNTMITSKTLLLGWMGFASWTGGCVGKEVPAQGFAGSPGEPKSEAEKSSVEAPSSLDAAHQAYLEGRFVDLAELVRAVLLDPSAGSLAKENALELLDKVYEVTKGRMPSRFETNGIPSLNLSVILHTRPEAPPWFTVYLYAATGKDEAIHTMRLASALGGELLDFQRGLGEATRKDEGFALEAKVDNPPGDGVYDIDVLTKGGKSAKGWVILRKMVATAAPDVLSPSPSFVFAEATPTLRWAPYRTADYVGYEGRTLSLWLREEQLSTPAWDYWTDHPGELSSMRVCDAPATGHTAARCQTLEPGGYWLSVTASEQRWFGPITLSRAGQTRVPFSVGKR